MTQKAPLRGDTPPLRMPRLVEADPRGPQVVRLLSTQTRLLWQGGEWEVPVAALSEDLSAALRSACRAGKVVQGLEDARRCLADEQRGLRLADRQSGVRRGIRVSRLLVLSADGAERFYRSVESLLRMHGPRLLALRLDVDAATLGELVFGPGRSARLVMLEHKDAVSKVLLALAGQDERPLDDNGA